MNSKNKNEDVLHNYTYGEIKEAMNIILKEWCCYDEHVATSDNKNMTDKQIKYMDAIRSVLSVNYFDHIFFGKDRRLIFEVHPYIRINAEKMRELAEFDKHTGIIVEILPASYWNVGHTTGIRFIIDPNITSIKQILRFNNDKELQIEDLE